MKRILLAFVLSAFAGLAGAQQLTLTDLGLVAPTPGSSDASQLLTTGDTVQLQDGAINYFYDNTSPNPVGTSFSTGANPGGYSLTGLAVKFGGGGAVGFAGGDDTYSTSYYENYWGGWEIRIYQLSGVGNTTATLVYSNIVEQINTPGNSGGADWLQFGGFGTNAVFTTPPVLAPNAKYAWTIFQPNGYDDLAYATGAPYTAGAICEIPPIGGTVTYYPADNDSATFDVGLSPIELPLLVSDLGSGVTPTPGPNDISQLQVGSGADPASGINYYDNDSGSSSPGASGQSFTTGSKPGGYVMSSLAVKLNGNGGGDDTSGSQTWRIVVFQLSGTGDVTATPLVTNTSAPFSTSTASGDDWLAFSGMYVPLLPNTVYAYTFDTASSPGYSGYDDLAVATVTPYTNGLICRIQDGGGTVTYYPADPNTASFDIGLALAGYPSVGVGSATPSAVYALSQVSLSDIASGPGTLTYQWQTNSDLSGGLNGTWANIPNATNLTLTFTPSNANSSTLDFQFVVRNSTGAATSAPIALVVSQAQAPSSSTGVTPSSITTYAGGTVAFSDTSFMGTTPITYQWQVNRGGGYVNIPSAGNPSATNSTLNLTNVQAANVGSYQLVAMNSQGTNDDSAETIGTLVLLAPPPLPVSTSPQNVPYLEYSNKPYAYWRLQETNNPASAPPTVLAYDYSGNGFFASYGVGVATSNAGPQAPFFPGFSTNELAAGISLSTSGFLTVPPLNLNTSTNVSFIAWINPNGGQSSSAALLFNRTGSDASGFGFNGNPNAASMSCLGFTWNSNASSTWGWNSGLYPVAGVWSFVAYVITPTNETTYLFYVDTTVTPHTTNFLQNSLNQAYTSEAFSTTSDLGSDPSGATRTFNGSMAEVALYTNSLSQQALVSMFLDAIGSTSAPVSPPLVLPSPSIFAGESIQLNGAAGGSGPITYQWKSSSDGVTWANVPTNANYSGVTSPILQINNATLANSLEYEVAVMNSSSTATSGVATVTVTAVPTGLWTANFQLTNATDEYGFVGLNSYAGPGVLGTGTYWNAIDDPDNAFAYGTFYSVSDFEDNGVTHTGLSVSIAGDGFTSQTAATPAGSIQTLLDQYIQTAATLEINGVPDGTYNLAVYTIDGSFANDSDNVTVNAANGTQTLLCINKQDKYFAPGDNTSIFTNVLASGGNLSVAFVTGGVQNADFCGLQLQMVSYATTVSNISLSYGVTNNSMTLTWLEGSLQTATNLAGPWAPLSDTSPATISTTNACQFFRLVIPAP
jgi:hypothetical protein